VSVPNLPLLVEAERHGHETPLIVTHPLEIGRVLAVSEELLADGLRAGLSVYQAQQLAPCARVVAAAEDAYHQRHEAIAAVAQRYTERIETAALGEWYLDWQGFQDEPAITAELRSALRAASGLPVRVGVANGKYTAQQAARASDLLIVAASDAARFLAPVPITELPDLPGEFRRRLELLDLHTLGDLAAISRAAMLSQFGPEMGFWHNLARGQDPRPLLPDAPPLREGLSQTLAEATASRVALHHVIQRLTRKVSARLRQRGYQAEALKLTLEDDWGRRLEAGQAVKPPSDNEERLHQIALIALGRLTVRAPVVRLEVMTYPLRPFHLSARNRTLAEPGQTEKQSRLQAALQTLRRRFGEGVVFVAAFAGLPLPIPIRVSLNGEGRPNAFTQRKRTYHILEWDDCWRVHRQWWTGRPIQRDYFQVIVADGSVRVLFQDLTTLEWFLDKGWGWLQ